MQVIIRSIVVSCALLVAGCVPVSSVQPAGVTTDRALELFAVEIKVGPNWDPSKPPAEQAFFSEHSANLNRLRDAGHIVMGARYSDIGLLIFSAGTAEEVIDFMSDDPSMKAGTFQYEVHPINVFYPGLVQASERK